MALPLSLQDRVERAFCEALHQVAARPSLARFGEAIDVARRQLHEPMRVALGGRIKAGKSTMANAFLGEILVPTGREELTFNVNRLRYGERRELVVHYRDDRPDEHRSLEELEELTRRREQNREALSGIDHIEVLYDNELLREFNLIDTPGLESYFSEDSQNTLDFLNLSPAEVNAESEREARNADAVLWLFTRSLAGSEQELVGEFTGPALGNASPINAIGVLTRTDLYWGDVDDPMQTGRQICSRLHDEPGVKRRFYALRPASGLIGAGAQTLGPEDLAAIGGLASLGDERLRDLLRNAKRFVQRKDEDIPVAPGERKQLFDRLGAYGILLATRIARDGGQDPNRLTAELLQRSGIGELRELVISHFGRRAYLIKLTTALRRVRVACFVERRAADASDRAAVDDVARAFEALQEQEHGFAELDALRAYYAGRLSFGESDAGELLRIVGEDGTSIYARLGLDAGGTPEQLAATAEERLRYWRARSNDFGMDRKTLRAARVMARSYERALHRARQLQAMASEY